MVAQLEQCSYNPSQRHIHKSSISPQLYLTLKGQVLFSRFSLFTLFSSVFSWVIYATCIMQLFKACSF